MLQEGDPQYDPKCHTDLSDDSEYSYQPIKLYPNITSWKILIYVPNLIDYLRYFLSIKGMQYAFVDENWDYFIIYYFVAISMDIIDGAFARLLDQVTKYGSCLDMVCDRASVSMMYVILGRVYPNL